MDRTKDDHATDSTSAETIIHRENNTVDHRAPEANVHKHKLQITNDVKIAQQTTMTTTSTTMTPTNASNNTKTGCQRSDNAHNLIQASSKALPSALIIDQPNSPRHHYHQYSRCVSVDGSSNAGGGIDTNTTLSKMRYHGRKSDSPPIRSPSYHQHRQYRSSVHRIATGNYSSMDVLHSNKENTVPVSTTSVATTIPTTTTSASPDIRLDSPKFALAQQNSPNTPLSSFKSPPSTHSSPMYTAHETLNDCNIFTYSPLISEPYKHSTYFHFPDVDQMSAPPPPSSLTTVTPMEANASNLPNDMNTLRIADAESPKLCGDGGRKTKKEAIRRARLKSISLDSEGARLVEENLCIPVEELVERTLPQTGAFTSEHGQSLNGSYEMLEQQQQQQQQQQQTTLITSPSKSSPVKNNQLVLDLSFRDETLARTLNRVDDDSGDDTTSTKLHTPKTPTLTQTRQKAISLDSAPKPIARDKRANMSSASSDNCHQPLLRAKPLLHCLLVDANASMSMPTTPKRHHLLKTNKQMTGDRSTTKSVKKTMCAGSGVNFDYFNLTGSSHGSSGLGVSIKSNTVDRKSMIDVGDAPAAYSISLPMTSNVNLKTLPEKTIICNFASDSNERVSSTFSDNNNAVMVERNEEDYYDEAYAGESDNASYTAADDIECDIIGGSVNSLISGSNLSSNNNGISGTGASSSRSQNALSLSNYSLSNFQGSHCSLARSNYNICGMTTSINSSIGSSANKSSYVNVSVVGSTTGSRMHSTQTNQSAATSAYLMSTSRSSINCCGKKNLLQRRGSNTSLTLNIVGCNGGSGSVGMGGGAHSTLNRFNSHSSLNVMSTPFDIQRNNLSNAKKGLLERRNSNASLTLNIQKRALSTSNCYLRGSDLSLSSSMNNYEQHLEEHQTCSMCGGGGILKKQFERKPTTKRTNASVVGQPPKIERSNDANASNVVVVGAEKNDRCQTSVGASSKLSESDVLVEQKEANYNEDPMCTKTSRTTHRRKFLSSENLNIHNTFSLCQLPIKTSSVFDLNQTSGGMLHHDTDYDDDDDDDDNELTYCPCTNNITRNITTKPLSPQTTSEDFKIYLANIQILQNASNLLSEHELNVLGHVFKRSYQVDSCATNANASSTTNKTTTTKTTKKTKTIKTTKTTKTTKAMKATKTTTTESGASVSMNITKSSAQLPSEREQNCLLTNLHQEFWDLPTNYQEKPLIFGSHAKNRYKTILPNEHSRVILDSERDDTDDDDAKEAKGRHPQEQSTCELYINANYIKGPEYTQNAYIATQGPMSNTIYDFWLMAYQNIKKSTTYSTCGLSEGDGDIAGQQKIVMLTDIIENDESKCAIYFPQSIGKVSCFLNHYGRRQKNSQSIVDRLELHFSRADVWPDKIPSTKICVLDCPFVPEDIDFSYICVKNVGVCNRKGYTLRKFHCIYHLNKHHLQLAASSDITRTTTTNAIDSKTYQFVAYHYWFPHWPDHRSPENIDVVLDMCIDLLNADCDLYFQTDEHNDGDHDHTYDLHRIEKSILATEMQKPIPAGGGPIPIIHCSAGIGRTGCVAAILNGIRQMRTSYFTAATKSGIGNHVSVDVLGIVSNLRLQRGGMVQNSEQYELIHRALCLYHERYRIE